MLKALLFKWKKMVFFLFLLYKQTMMVSFMHWSCGSTVSRHVTKYYFRCFFWGYFWMRLAFRWVTLSKADCPLLHGCALSCQLKTKVKPKTSLPEQKGTLLQMHLNIHCNISSFVNMQPEDHPSSHIIGLIAHPTDYGFPSICSLLNLNVNLSLSPLTLSNTHICVYI